MPGKILLASFTLCPGTARCWHLGALVCVWGPECSFVSHLEPGPRFRLQTWVKRRSGLGRVFPCWVVESYLADVRKRPDLGLKRPDPGPGRKKLENNNKKLLKIRKIIKSRKKLSKTIVARKNSTESTGQVFVRLGSVLGPFWFDFWTLWG